MNGVQLHDIERAIRGDMPGRPCTAQAAVYAFLLEHGDGAMPSLASIAREVGRSRQTVADAVQALARKGWLQITEVTTSVEPPQAIERTSRRLAVSQPRPLQLTMLP